MTVDEQINQFADLLRKLTVEYDIFFAGGRKLPPTSLKFKVESLIKRLLEEQMSYAQRFKYNQLVAKFSLYRDVWRRNMQAHEEGGKLRSQDEIDRLLGQDKGPDTNQEIKADSFSLLIREPVAENSLITELFERLVEMRRRHGERDLSLNFDRFQQLVEQKAAEVRSVYQCAAAEFVVFHDAQQERVRFQVKANRALGPNPDQTLTGYIYTLGKESSH